MWIDASTMQVFTQHDAIRRAYRNVSFPMVISDSDLAAVGLVPVRRVGAPAFNRLTHETVSAPLLIDGEWVEQWDVVPLSVSGAAAAREALTSEIAARRYARETDGITIPPGIPIDTGRDSQALITGAVVAAMVDPAYVCRWKTDTGFVDLSAAELIEIGTAVRSHVQACFDREAVLLAAVADGSFTEGMLDEGWPNA
jgi:hypothetical protein